jgi:predicted membrane channel-forming protein YqfA (hemolysin III family)
MEKEKTTQSIGLGTSVFLIFLALKLGGFGVVANWSWWWVCSPLWLPLFIVFCILGIVGVFVIIRDILNNI